MSENVTLDELRAMVPVAGMLRAPDASPQKPSPVLDAAAVRDLLLARLDRAEAEVPYLKHLNVESGQLDITIEGAKQVTAMMAESLAQMFRESGGVNYVQFEVRSGKHDYILLLQLASGKTPHQLRQEAERERDDARAEVARLRAAVASLRAALTTAKERQREACEKGAIAGLRKQGSGGILREKIRLAIRATPLVEDEP